MYAIIQKHKRLAALIIAVASLSFLFWMFSVSDVRQMFGLKGCVAQVNGSCITHREFRYELLRYSDLLDKEEIKNVVKRQVLYSLIGREALYQKALELGIRASDREVADYIKMDPSFQRNGSFDPSLYRGVLERVGLTPEEYEMYLKKKLTVKRLFNFLSKGVYLTDREGEVQKKLMTVRLRGKLYLLTPDSVSVTYRPNREEIERFYRENRDKFLLPEKRIFLMWKTESKEEAHRLYSDLKKGRVPEGGTLVEGIEGFPAGISKEVGRLEKKGSYTITKLGETYYVIYLKDVEPKRLMPLSEVEDEVKKLILEGKREEMLLKKAEEIKEGLSTGRKVGVRPLEFDNSTLEEFVKLFNLKGEDILRLVFSREKVFGPYRTARGVAVILIEGRDFKESGVLDYDDTESLRKAKEEALIDLFAKKVIDKAEKKINEEYLR